MKAKSILTLCLISLSALSVLTVHTVQGVDEAISLGRSTHIALSIERYKSRYEEIKTLNVEKLLVEDNQSVDLADVVAPFNDIVGPFELGIDSRESIAVDMEAFEINTPLNLFNELRAVTMMMLLKAKANISQMNEEVKGIDAIFKARVLANQLVKHDVYFIAFTGLAIRDVARKLLCTFIIKAADYSDLEKISSDLEKETPITVAHFREMLSVEKDTVIKVIQKEIIERISGSSASLKLSSSNGLEETVRSVREKSTAYQVSIPELTNYMRMEANRYFTRIDSIFNGSASYKVKKERWHALLKEIELSLEKIESNLMQDEATLSGLQRDKVIQMVYKSISDIVFELLLSGNDSAYDAMLIDHVKENQLHINIILRRYKLDEGVYPDSLSSIRDKGTVNILRDPFSDTDYKYERSANGLDFLLWSIGPDLIDDGGKERYTSKGKRGDIFI